MKLQGKAKPYSVFVFVPLNGVTDDRKALIANSTPQIDAATSLSRVLAYMPMVHVDIMLIFFQSIIYYCQPPPIPVSHMDRFI